MIRSIYHSPRNLVSAYFDDNNGEGGPWYQIAVDLNAGNAGGELSVWLRLSLEQTRALATYLTEAVSIIETKLALNSQLQLQLPAANDVCGCTDEEACQVDKHGQRRGPEELAELTVFQWVDLQLVPCSWIEQDLCSACVQDPAAPLLFDGTGRPLRGAP